MSENLLTLWRDAIPPEKIPKYPTVELKKAVEGDLTYEMISLEDGSFPTFEMARKGCRVDVRERPAKPGELLREADLRFVPDWTENLKHRTEVITLAKGNPPYQKFQLDLCRSSILYYVNTFVWTFDPRRDDKDIPFVTYPYQDDLLTWWLWNIRNANDTVVVKSREQGASWSMEAKNSYLANFENGFLNYQLSMREEDVDDRTVDSLLGKFRYIQDSLPDWMKNGWIEFEQDIDNKMKIKIPSQKSLVKGKLTNSSVGRGGRAMVADFDEAAHIAADVEVAKASSSLAKSCNWFSTVNGKGNLFHVMATQPGMRVKKLHYTLHPLKGYELHSQWAIKERSKGIYAIEEVWEQEQSMSFETSTMGRVYVNFLSSPKKTGDWCHVQKGKLVEYDPTYNVISMWDFGMRDPTSIAFAQIKPTPPHLLQYTKETLVFFDEEESSYMDPYEWADVINAKGYHYEMHIGDYRTANQIQVFKRTWKEYLGECGIHLVGRYNSEDAPIMEVQKLLRVPGRLVVNANCSQIVDSFQSWSYPVDKSTNQVPPGAKPKHDIFSHKMKAVCYGVDYIYNMNKKVPRPPEKWNHPATTLHSR